MATGRRVTLYRLSEVRTDPAVRLAAVNPVARTMAIPARRPSPPGSSDLWPEEGSEVSALAGAKAYAETQQQRVIPPEERRDSGSRLDRRL